jgi:transcriptional regulator with XRE-family HTH domain
MEPWERIKLMRSLTANAQKDIAQALGVTPGYYALQEAGKAKLGTAHAVRIATVLSLHPLWITEGIQPVTESPFLLFALPARELDLAIKHIRSRMNREAQETIHAFLPAFLDENVAGVFCATYDEAKKIYLLKLNSGTPIIIKVADGMMTGVFDDVFRRSGCADKNPLAIDEESFENIVPTLRRLLKHGKYSGEKIDNLTEDVAAASRIAAKAKQVDRHREAMVQRLAEEMIRGEIRTEELAEYLAKVGRGDLARGKQEVVG